MTILLFGSHGFLGTHVLARLERAGHTVIRGSRDVAGIQMQECDVAVNCAGETENPAAMWWANCDFAGDLVDTANRFGKRLIHVGSITEILPGDTLYQVTERAVTDVCLAYHREFGTNVSIARFSTLYGPGDKDSAFFPTLYRAYCEGKEFICRNETRDWLHVTDAANAILTVIEKGESGRVYDIATNERYSNRALVVKFEVVVRDGVRLRLGDEDPVVWPKFDRAEILSLGWTPELFLDKGIADFVIDAMCRDQVWTGAEL